MRAGLVIAFATITASVMVGVGGAGAAAPTTCPGIKGAVWKIGGRTGTTYTGHVRGILCGYILGYVSHLTGPHKPHQVLTGGPTGWTCQADQEQDGTAHGNWYGFTCFNSSGKAVVVLPSP
jgi:hypothetical protein